MDLSAQEQDDALTLDAEERMATLAQASELAAALAAVFKLRGDAEPAVIAAWRTLAATHPLPEVRRPWRRGSHEAVEPRTP